MECPKCQTDNPSDSKFCKECATPLPSSIEAQPSFTKTLETHLEELTRGTLFADRYEIIEELGKGGMGKVYRVEDTKTREEIALKLIKPEISTDKKTIERFRNELTTARKIAHRNVCRMFDLGEDQGKHFITMEYVSGEDLKSFIHRSEHLAIPKAITISKQVCEGLSEAHRLGVVHRDLKSSNIMIDKEGNVRIMDFGIARSLSAKGITGSGVMIGTPEYMSPEQAEAKDVDQRSDIYSLGVILYEMVTGRVPFDGDTALSIAMKHKSEVPKNPKEYNAQIPDDLGCVILNCLEKNKEARYQSAREVRSELENIEKGIPTIDKEVPKKKPITSKEITVTFGLKKLMIPALVVIAIVFIGLIIWSPWKHKEFAQISSEKPSIGVLPFDDLSPQKDQESFCIGLAESLINALTRIQELRVPAITSSSLVKKEGNSIQEVGKRLSVKSILRGSVQKAEKRVRITAQLISTDDEALIWSDQYNQDWEDIFAIQDDITQAIVDNLKLRLVDEEKKELLKHPTDSIEAYNFYLQGRFFWNKRTGRDLNKAIEYFEQAIEIDPNFALAYVGLADSIILLPTYGFTSEKVSFQKGREAVKKALEIDDTLAEAHATMAAIFDWYDWDFEAANREYKRAIELTPGYATTHHWYALHLSRIQAKFDDAINEIKRAHELDPLSLPISGAVGQVFLEARQPDKAIEAQQKTLEIDPNFWAVHSILGDAYLQKSMYEEALAAFQKAKEIHRRWNPSLERRIGITCTKMGKREEAQQVLADLIEKSRQGKTAPYHISILCFGLGENDKGFEWLKKAYEEHDVSLVLIKRELTLDSVRTDPRFIELLKKMNLM